MKPVLLAAVACLTVSACVGRVGGPAPVNGAQYQDWSCDRLSQELARTDAGFSQGQRSAVERAMAAHGCVRPLAAETE